MLRGWLQRVQPAAVGNGDIHERKGEAGHVGPVVHILFQDKIITARTTAAAHEAFEAVGRDVAKLPPLSVDGDQTHWLLLKP